MFVWISILCATRGPKHFLQHNIILLQCFKLNGVGLIVNAWVLHDHLAWANIVGTEPVLVGNISGSGKIGPSNKIADSRRRPYSFRTQRAMDKTCKNCALARPVDSISPIVSDILI